MASKMTELNPKVQYYAWLWNDGKLARNRDGYVVIHDDDSFLLGQIVQHQGTLGKVIPFDPVDHPEFDFVSAETAFR